MKLSLFVSILAPLVLAVSPVMAQSDDSSPAAVPEAMVGQFFQQLIEGRVDAAYDQLLKGSRIGESAKSVGDIKLKTKEALRVFGSIGGFEKLQTQTLGSRIVRLTCVSQGKELPIRWRFFFYKPAENWKLIDIRIEDVRIDLFEETAAKAAAAPQSPAK